MAYEGFSKVQSSIEKDGKSKKVAGAIAASIGRKKYGKKKFDSAASKGEKLKGAIAAKMMSYAK